MALRRKMGLRVTLLSYGTWLFVVRYFNVSGVKISWLNLIRGVESAWAVTVDLRSIWYRGCQSHDWEPNASRIWEGTLTR